MTVRIWFLLLLAVLLPVRGAVAAAMLCPVANSGVQIELSTGHQSPGHEAMDRALSNHAASGHDHSTGHDHAVAQASDGQPAHDHATADACNACSAYCSLTPLVSHLPTLREPLGVTSVRFPGLSAPPPSFVSDGQERPPKTI